MEDLKSDITKREDNLKQYYQLLFANWIPKSENLQESDVGMSVLTCFQNYRSKLSNLPVSLILFALDEMNSKLLNLLESITSYLKKSSGIKDTYRDGLPMKRKNYIVLVNKYYLLSPKLRAFAADQHQQG